MRKATEQKRQASTLPADANGALKNLISISRKLCLFADQEMHALTIGDMLRFAYTQKDKEKVAEEYAQASEDFRIRVEQFRSADKNLLKELESLQVELKTKSTNNNDFIRKIRDRAISNTKGTLFTAQELGQKVQVTFPVRKPLYEQQGI